MEHTLIALSGGVDSAVAAYTLLEKKHKVSALTIKFHNLDPKSIHEAQQLAQKLKIRHYTLDMTTEFAKTIVDKFVDQYSHGKTPNPCIFCNPQLKFAALSAFAQELSCTNIATGHYAQIKTLDGYYHIAKATNKLKDQSYVLYRLQQEVLKKLLFPLDKITDKEQVRQIAKELELNVHDKKDSQDICFIKDNDYKNFLIQKNPELKKPGNIILEQTGQILGKHEGIAFYTVGQRKGLGIAYKQPLYITKIRANTNEIFVGIQESLFKTTIIAQDTIFSGAQPCINQTLLVDAKIRYAHVQSPAKVTINANNSAQVDFFNPQKAITPGQAVVFYFGDIVIGGGTINKSYK